MLGVLEDDLVTRNCKCIGMVRKERKRCKEIVMAMADRLGLEERIHVHTRRKGDKEMRRIVEMLLQLQSSLKKEQTRVESLLSSKDLLISQLQIQAGKLRKDNEKLTVFTGVKRKISLAEDRSSKLTKVPLKPRSQLSSDSGCENPASDNASLFDESNEVDRSNQLNPSALTLSDCTTLSVQPPVSDTPVMSSAPPASSKSQDIIQQAAAIKRPKPPVASRESVNAKLYLVQPNEMDYVLVTKDGSDATKTTGLYVLDTVPASDCTNNDINRGLVATEKTIITAVHAMTNHRACLTPSDIKYRAKIKSVSLSQKTTLSYWTDTFL